MRQSNRSGNVLFLILIAVALFAALSYAVTSSNKGGGSGITKDKAKLLAAELVQYTTQIEQTVTRLRLMNQCSDTDLSFYTGSYPYTGGYFVPDDGVIPPVSKCNIFHVDGGGMSAQQVPEGIGTLVDYTTNDFFAESYLPLRTYIRDIGRNYESGTDWEASELAITVQMQNKEVCIAINNQLGIPNPSGEPPVSTGSGNVLSSACEIEQNRVCSIGNRAYGIPGIDGKYSGCFYQSNNSAHITSPRYTYFHVIYAQ